MKRKIMDKLEAWRTSGKNRLPLLLYGARQVEKPIFCSNLDKNILPMWYI